MTIRATYETPQLEVQPLRTLPSALASSGCPCRVSPSKGNVSSSEGSNHMTHKK